MKKSFFAIFFMLLCCCLSACGPEDDQKVSFAIIAGVHSNMNVLPLSSETIQDQLYNAAYAYADITFVECDGDPRPVYRVKIPKPEVSGLSAEKKKSMASEYAAQLQKKLGETMPSVGEVNTLEALSIAGQALKDGDVKTLLILDSGLCTTGYLNFTEGLLNVKTDDIVAAIKDKKALPDLSGVSVYWAFCGETGQPQEPLSKEQQKKLQEIWQAILLKANAEKVVFTNDFTSAVAYAGLPEVSLVDVDKEWIDVEIEEELPIIETSFLDTYEVPFLGDSAEFADQETAEQSISEVAKLLLSYPGNRIYIVGTTASGRVGFCEELSEDRALAVKELLISMGVPERQLISVGMGFENPWHVEDLDAKGKLVEEAASKNRRVWIFDEQSEEGKIIKGLMEEKEKTR